MHIAYMDYKLTIQQMNLPFRALSSILPGGAPSCAAVKMRLESRLWARTLTFGLSFAASQRSRCQKSTETRCPAGIPLQIPVNLSVKNAPWTRRALRHHRAANPVLASDQQPGW